VFERRSGRKQDEWFYVRRNNTLAHWC